MKPAFVRRLLAALFVVTAFGLGCRDGIGPTGPDGIPPGSGRLSVVAMFELNTATNLVIEVTAPDIPQALVFNLDIVNGTATGSVTIPAGANRLITVRAFDGRTETHRGSRTVTIVAGTNPPLSLALLPLAGTVPVTVSFGVAVVSVTPLTWTLAVDSTVVFAATVMDATGAMQTDAIVRWASTDTRKLTIDSTGRAMARDTGMVMVVAVSGGAAGRATVTVTPAIGPVAPSFTRTWVGGNGSGGSQTSWVNPNNWTPAAVPTANDSVVIGAATFQPVLPATDTLQVRDLTLLQGANVSLSFRTLTVNGGTLAGLGGVFNTGSGGTVRVVGNARLRGTLNTGIAVQGGGTVALADSVRMPSLSVSGTSTVLDLAGRKLVLTSTGTALNVFTEGLLRMNNPADTLDVAGNIFLQGTAAAHAGNLTAGTMILRGSISDGTRYEASGTHRTVFAGAATTFATQSVGSFDVVARPANMLQDVVVSGTSAWSNCSSRLSVRGSFTVTSPTTLSTCTSWVLNIDGPITTVAGSTLGLYGLTLGDTTGVAGINGAFSVDFLTFTAVNPQLRAGLAYRTVTFQRSVAIADSIRTTGLVTVTGAGSVLDVATAAGRAATFAGLTVSDGAAFAMQQATDSLVVAGPLTAMTSIDLAPLLSAGTLRVSGSLNVSTLGTTGTHRTVLDGANATTWQDISSMDFNARSTNRFRNLTIANTGIGARSCFSNVRVTGAFRVTGTSTYSTCTSNFTRVDSLLATDAGTSVTAYGFTLANANGTQDVLGTWTPAFTDFTLPNQPVRATLGYQTLRFFASNTLPPGLTATTALLIDGTTTVLALSDGRVTAGTLTTQSGGQFAMNTGDTLRVTGAVNLNGGQSAPSGGVLEIESNFNANGYSPTGTHELRLQGAAAHSLGGFNDRPLPKLRVVSGSASLNFMNLIVQDSLILAAAGTAFTTLSSNFVTVRNALVTAAGSSMTPYGVALEGPTTLAAVSGSFAPTILRVTGPGTGAGTVLRNAANLVYNNVEFLTSYALSDSLSVGGRVTVSGAGVQFDWNGRKVRAPDGMWFQSNATARMVNAADSLIAGDGTNATAAVRFNSGTAHTISAGHIIVQGGSNDFANLLTTGTNRVLITDLGLAAAARLSQFSGSATLRRLEIRGQPQFTTNLNFITLNVTDSLLVTSGELFLTSSTVNVDGAGAARLVVGATGVVRDNTGGSMNLYNSTGTSLVASGGTYTVRNTRMYATGALINPALTYTTLQLFAPTTLQGPTTITENLLVQNTGSGLTLGGHRLIVGGNVDLQTNGVLVMNQASDSLDVTGDLRLDGGTAGTYTNGTIVFRGNTLTGTNYVGAAPHRFVFAGATGAPQFINGATTFGRLTVAGGRGINVNFTTATVSDSMVVTSAVPITGSSANLIVNGVFRTTQPIALSVTNLRLRDTTGTTRIDPTSNITAGTIFLDHPTALPVRLAPGLQYFALGIQSPVTLEGNVTTLGNVSVSGGALPRLTIGPRTLTVGGALTVDGALVLQDTGRVNVAGNVTFNSATTTDTRLTNGIIRVGGNLSVASANATASGTHRYVLARDDAAEQTVNLGTNINAWNLEIAGNGSRTIRLNDNLRVLGAFQVTSPATIAVTQNSTWTLQVDGPLETSTNTTMTIPGTLLLTNASGLSQALGPNTLTTLQYGGTAQNQILPTATRHVITNFNVLAGASATMATTPNTSFRIGAGTAGSMTVNGTFNMPAGNTLNVCGGLAGTGTINGGVSAPSSINLRTTSSQVSLTGSVVINQNQPSTITGC